MTKIFGIWHPYLVGREIKCKNYSDKFNYGRRTPLAPCMNATNCALLQLAKTLFIAIKSFFDFLLL